MGKKKKLSKSAVALIITAVILAIAIIGCVAVLILAATTDTIYPNVYIAGTNVGGMTKEEALQALDAHVDELYGASDVVIQLPDRTIVFTPDLVNASLNADEAIEEAWTFGRSGDILTRGTSYLKAMTVDTAFTVNAGLAMDEEAIKAYIAEQAEEIHTDVIRSKVDVREEQDFIEVTVGTTGIDLDQDAAYNAVAKAIAEINFVPIEMDYAKTPYPALDLTSVYQQLFTAVSDAYYDAETHEIVAEQVGYGFDLAAANQKIAMAEDGEVIRIALEEVQPTQTKAQLEEIYFVDELASFSTGSLGSYNRVNNITKACETLNGTVLAPGEVFSYNNTIGQRTEARGYLPAGAYVSGKSVSEVGGGICQVSSTLYYCTLMANLEIVSRTCHMFTVAYVDFGMDATVSWPNPDFQFKNNTEYPIRIEAKVEDYQCKIALIGTKTDNIKVEMSYEILSTIPYTTTTTEDPEEVNSSGRTGYNVVTYRHLIDEETGEEISKTIEAYSYYNKSDIVVLQKKLEEEVDNRLDEEEEKKKQEEEEQKKQEEENNQSGESTPPADTPATPPADTPATPPADTPATPPAEGNVESANPDA